MAGHFYLSTHLLFGFLKSYHKNNVPVQIPHHYSDKWEATESMRRPLTKTLGKIWSPLSFLGITRSHQQLANHFLPKSQWEVVDVWRAIQKVCNPSKQEAEHTSAKPLFNHLSWKHMQKTSIYKQFNLKFMWGLSVFAGKNIWQLYPASVMGTHKNLARFNVVCW